MTAIVNTKLGEHKGAPRVWLEGQKLAREGYEPGMKYNLMVDVDGQRAMLRVADSGTFTVSRRQRNGRVTPIIDLRASELAELFAGVERLRVAIKKGVIVITAHHQEGKVREREERLIRKLQTGEPLAVCGLFHGAGIIDKAVHAGLKQAGIASAVKVAVEIEGKYLDASLANNPELWREDSIAIESPIQEVNLDNAGALGVDCLVAGVPCTGASRSGKSKNKLKHAESHPQAGAMFYSFLQFVQTLNPSAVILENVVDYRDTASMEVIRSVLDSLGYEMSERTLEGLEFGALERRNRLCMVALSKGLKGQFDLDAVAGTPQPRQLKDVLEYIPDDSDRWKTYDYLEAKAKRDKAEGKGFARQLLTGDEAYCGVLGAGYAKGRSTEPFIKHPDPNDPRSRLLTPTEHCAVKGIPKEVINGLADSVAHAVLGQSVIFPAFKAVAKRLGEALMAFSQTRLLTQAS